MAMIVIEADGSVAQTAPAEPDLETVAGIYLDGPQPQLALLPVTPTNESWEDWVSP